jgi:hypothetical protein
MPPAGNPEVGFFHENRPHRVMLNPMKILPPTISAPRLPSAVFGLLLVLAGSVPASVTPGAEPKKWPANPAKHQLTVSRKAADATQARMIAAAEEAKPAAEALRKAIGDGPAPTDESQWWYRETLGIRIPIAVTADAVAYYSKLVEGYQKQVFERYMEPSSSLTYQAASTFHPQFEHGGRKFKDVHVVTLKLSFSQNFAATVTEGMEFQKERAVVLDVAGKVLAIIGDGPTEVPVLAI